MSESHIPVSMRSTRELRAKACELRQMAQAARTADVQAALGRLADRYDVLADARCDPQEQHDA
jgi:hypothetical protein